VRNPRTEIISIDSDRLAKHAFAMGFFFIHAAPVANGKRLSVCSASEYKVGAQGYGWWRSRKDATKILGEMTSVMSAEEMTFRIDGDDVLVEAAVDLATVFFESLEWRWHVKTLAYAEIDATIASVKQEIERWLVRLQCSGVMKIINGEYKALRARPRPEGEKFPAYRVWATGRLEQQILQRLELEQRLAADGSDLAFAITT